MCLAATGALVATDWGSLAMLDAGGALGLAVVIGMGILSESLAIRLKIGRDAGNTTITFIPLLASVQLFGPAAGVVLMATTGAYGEFVVRRKTPIRGVFNVAQWTVATFLSGLVFSAFGGVPLESVIGNSGPVELSSQLLPFTFFGMVFLVANHAFVSLVIALSQSLRFGEVMAQMVGHSGAGLHDLLISPIAIAIAFLYLQVGVTGILVVFLPLLFIRHSYLTTSRLREANADLLKALVKAIETRDPYTSGHSLRVSYLARKIAEAIGLPRSSVERVEQAALLHDIGKIESLYTGILAKPDALTPEERSIIESHVTKGEELLRNLSSFPEDIILSVRHHHEREDGGGYPDGLTGERIPIGARIIAVCDAVDAMLSDRPYRAALTVPTVLHQLKENSGRQFAPQVVQALLGSDLITEYADLMRASRHGTPWDAALDAERLASRRLDGKGPSGGAGRRRREFSVSTRPRFRSPL